jgi:hypothetical protein
VGELAVLAADPNSSESGDPLPYASHLGFKAVPKTAIVDGNADIEGTSQNPGW